MLKFTIPTVDQNKFLLGLFSGLMLGDGYLDKGTNKHAFEVKSINKDFIELLETIVKNCNSVNLSYRITTIPEHYSCGCNHKECWCFKIQATEFFNEIHDNSYSIDRKRIITQNLLDKLNLIGLAFWYMSDGYICLVGKTKGSITDRRLDICTDRYNLSDIQLLKNHLETRMGLTNLTIYKRNNTHRLRIGKDGYENFIDNVKPFIVDSMLKKLYLGYDKKPTWYSATGWEFQEYLKTRLQP